MYSAQSELLVSNCLPCTPIETETFSCEILTETMQIRQKVWSFPLGKKTKQAKVKPNQTKDGQLGKRLGTPGKATALTECCVSPGCQGRDS